MAIKPNQNTPEDAQAALKKILGLNNDPNPDYSQQQNQQVNQETTSVSSITQTPKDKLETPIGIREDGVLKSIDPNAPNQFYYNVSFSGSKTTVSAKMMDGLGFGYTPEGQWNNDIYECTEVVNVKLEAIQNSLQWMITGIEIPLNIIPGTSYIIRGNSYVYVDNEKVVITNNNSTIIVENDDIKIQKGNSNVIIENDDIKLTNNNVELKIDDNWAYINGERICTNICITTDGTFYYINGKKICTDICVTINSDGNPVINGKTVCTAPCGGGSGTTCINTTLTVSPASGQGEESVNLTGVLTGNNNPIPNELIIFSVNGNSIGTATTDSSGTAILSYTITETSGSYSIDVTFGGDSIYCPSEGTNTLTVTCINTTLTVSPASGQGEESVNLTGVLTGNNNPIPNELIIFSVNGNSIGTATTDSSGTAILSYTITETSGSYSIDVTFGGDSIYCPSEGTNTLTVVTEVPSNWYLIRDDVVSTRTEPGFDYITTVQKLKLYIGSVSVEGDGSNGFTSFEAGPLGYPTISLFICTGFVINDDLNPPYLDIVGTPEWIDFYGTSYKCVTNSSVEITVNFDSPATTNGWMSDAGPWTTLTDWGFWAYMSDAEAAKLGLTQSNPPF